MNTILRLYEWWTAEGANRLISPASLMEIERLESRYSIALPREFRQYLSAIAPKEEVWDEEQGTWCSIASIRSVQEECNGDIPCNLFDEAEKLLVFLDHMHWSWAWAICCVEGVNFGKIAIVGRGDGRYVANSFYDFINLYIDDWQFVI